MANSTALILGPLLGYEQGGYYTVCIVADATVVAPTLELSNGAVVAFSAVAVVTGGQFWRAEFPIAATVGSQTITYRVRASGLALADSYDRDAWTFFVPEIDARARLAFASCNGFSDAKLMRDTAKPFALWERMASEHATKPFGLLLMGGDQLYADEIWTLPGVKEWAEKSRAAMLAYTPSAMLVTRIEKFYDELYAKRWRQSPQMALLLASIPSVMMWDDHDIFDGWGSHEPELQACAMYQAIYAAARRSFELYQLRTRSNRSLLNRVGEHYALRCDFADFHLLTLDNRSGRTIDVIMTETQWSDTTAALAAIPATTKKTTVVMTGVPVVYRSFDALEGTFEVTPWEEESTDDIRDHWMARHHGGERARLIQHLLKRPTPTWLLSGDVHIGALGMIHDAATGRRVYQVISTGIVHPAPSAFQWAALQLLTNDAPHTLPGTQVRTEMITPYRSTRYIRDRNFATFNRDSVGKLWVNWICENPNLKPEFVA